MTSDLPSGTPHDHEAVDFAGLCPASRRGPEIPATLEALLALAPAGLALLDSELRYVHVNELLAHLNGVPLDEHLGRSIEDIIPALAPSVMPWLRAVLETGEPHLDVPVMQRVQRPPSEARHFAASYYPVPIGGGRGVGVVVIDVTEHVRATQRIARLQDITAGLASAATPAEVADVVLRQGLAALGAAAGTIAVATDDGLGLELVGAAGYPAAVLGARHRFPLSAATPCGHVVRSGMPIFLENAGAWTDHGTEEPPMLEEHRSWVCLPLLAHGRAIGACRLSFRDVRPFPPDERAFMLTLARLCAQALERARLFEAAEQANRANEQFLAVLSHELRTPLTAILGWLQILRAKAPDAAHLERALRVMERNARSEVRLIDDILDVSRIVANKLPLEMRAVDINAVARAAVDLVAPAAEAGLVTLEAALDPTPIIVIGDAVRLQQVIGNLLANALKFTPRRGRVRIESARVGDEVRVRVSDTGQGIDAELLPHVFERFRQGDSSTTRAHGGLGLGLTIARHLVEQHRGALTAASPGAGLGATFTVTLPAAPGTVEPEARGSDPGSERRRLDSSRACRLRGVRVLVVDDEPDNAELVGEILRRQGAVVALADSSPAALAVMAMAPFDVLLCDISMPQEDGYTLLRKARALLASLDRVMPAAALTAHSGAEDVARCLSAGFQAHLSKPLDPDRVIDTVAELVAAPR